MMCYAQPKLGGCTGQGVREILDAKGHQEAVRAFKSIRFQVDSARSHLILP